MFQKKIEKVIIIESHPYNTAKLKNRGELMAKYNNQPTLELMKQLSEQDIQLCCAIYEYQLLTSDLIGEWYYLPSEQKEALDGFLDRLKAIGVIEEDKDNKNCLYLTTAGVNVVREALALKPNKITTSNKIEEKNYYRASKLRPKPQFLNRQIRLVSLVKAIEFMFNSQGGKKLGIALNPSHHKDSTFDYKYIDQRHIEKQFPYFSTLKPHGLFLSRNKKSNRLIAQSILIVEGHMTGELMVKSLLNKYVKPHLKLKDSTAKNKQVIELIYLLVEERQKESVSNFLDTVKEDYATQNLILKVVTRDELLRLAPQHLERLLTN